MAPSSSSAPNGLREFATPRKDKDRDRHQLPQSSPAPMKPSGSSATVHSHSISTSSVSANALPTPTVHVTVEALLRQHATSADPKSSALDQVVNERNTLSSQNAQLWKLVEKQRAGYNTILKEFERIRGERDSWKSRALGSSEGNEKSSSSKADRTPKIGTTELPSSMRQPGKANGTSRSSSSDEYLGGGAPSSLHSSRSYEPLASQSDTNLQSNAAYTPSTPVRAQSPPPPPGSAPSVLTTPHNARTTVTQRTAVSPLVMSARYDSHVQVPGSESSRPVQANDDVANASVASVNPYLNGTRAAAVAPRKSSLTEYATTSSIPMTNPPGSSANGAAQAPFSYPSSTQAPAIESQKGDQHNEANPSPYPRTLASESRPPPASLVGQGSSTSHATPQITTTSFAPSQPPVPLSPTEPQMLSAIDARSPYLSRDSRITLPDEARRYITNMVDSPAVSPMVNSFSASPMSAMQVSALNDSASKGEFLELDDDEDDEGDDDSEDEGETTDTNESGSRHSLQIQEPTTPTHSNFTRSDDLSAEATPNRSRKEKPPTVPNEFPLVTPTNLQPQRQDSQQLSPAKASNSTDQPSPNIAHQSQESLNSGRGYSSSKQTGQPSSLSDMRMPTSATPSAQALSAAFRALPLLSSDLPYTTVTVSHSFVRPNDRGKEVLSFVVSVNPGNGKPGWKVEKLYSDVLNLDQRVRSSVGKGVGKKIVNLPEGKLWKDHAPARVDQRKAVLEQYLQSLIQLPIKSNDEVIAFFTSDIVRETKQPVMQVGHKEGYLTKRGKNFGGWKTRFFVLQGPVLEYYDCRGGQHLGSIQITGAQIARQHRTDRTASTDEEKEYRHAFLIVEAKKGPGGNHPRHVLCAESDEERDDWVELLVRYYTGTYNEELVFNQNPGLNTANSNSYAATQHSSTPSQPRSSTSSSDIAYTAPSRKQPSRPSLATDDYTRSSSPSRSVDPSPIDRPAGAVHEAQMRRTVTERSAASAGLTSSLPDSSPLSSVPGLEESSRVERANSELGHYPDLTEPQRSAQPRQLSPERHRPRDIYEGRQTNYSSANLAVNSSTQLDRAPSPEKLADPNPRVKISRPMNGAPIPTGFKFGGGAKDPSSDGNSSSDRREKAKSRSFWGFGKTGGGGDRSHPTMVPRAVFAVPLVESLDVAQLCGLPAIVFRCIEYLENKKADQEEGIYRLNGSSAVIKGLRDRFNNEGDVDLLATEEYLDPHAVAGLLKSFLRDLPDSILTRDLHLRFLAVIDLTDAQERIQELSQLIAALPIANYTLLRALTAHLILIVQNAHVNKMTMRNVGIVFSPTLGIPAGVFSLMLGEFNRVFNVDMDDDGSIRTPDAGQSDSSEPMRRNSRQYTDNAADQFLGLTGRTLHAPTADDTQSQSDADDLSVQDESGTENTDGDPEVDSSSTSSLAPEGSQQEHGIRISPPDTPVATKMSKASSVAASKGLNLTVTGAERGHRHSRLMGLPTSPRPTHSPSRATEASS